MRLDRRLPLLLLPLLAGCTWRPAPLPAPAAGIPTAFQQAGGEVTSPDRWWEAFGDGGLNRALPRLFAENLRLRQAFARVEQARARAIQAGASLTPNLDLTGGATRLRSGLEQLPTSLSRERVYATTKEYTLGLAASYELDLWGRLRAGRQAAAQDVIASRQDLESMAMSLAAEFAEQWFTLAEQQARARLIAEQIQTNRTFVELLELRQKNGLAAAVDVLQQRQILAQTESLLPACQAQATLLEHALHLLLGEAPLGAVTPAALPELPPLPDLGIPAERILARPDVRAAWARLEAGAWRVSEARAARLPAIRLSATGTLKGNGLEAWRSVFDNWYLNLASAFTAPLWDGRRRSAEVLRTRAALDETLAGYRLTVLTALKEVEDALVRESRAREVLGHRARQLDLARTTLDESQRRYSQGVTDYLPVLQAVESVQRLERDVLELRRQLFGYRIGLCRALGGEWSSSLLAPAAEVMIDWE